MHLSQMITTKWLWLARRRTIKRASDLCLILPVEGKICWTALLLLSWLACTCSFGFCVLEVFNSTTNTTTYVRPKMSGMNSSSWTPRPTGSFFLFLIYFYQVWNRHPPIWPSLIRRNKTCKKKMMRILLSILLLRGTRQNAYRYRRETKKKYPFYSKSHTFSGVGYILKVAC